jgi:hypothetical protein
MSQFHQKAIFPHPLANLRNKYLGMVDDTTVSRSITFFFWESDLLEKGAICSKK